MAIVSHPADYAAPSVKIGQNAAKAIFYVLVGAIAIAIAVPAAIATADAGLFNECYTACAAG